MKRNRLFILFAVLSFHFISAQYTSDDWKSRDRWMQIDKLFQLIDLQSGNLVADVGCHEGYLTMHLSKKVGSNGKVYAVDVRNDRLERLKANAEDRNVKNVTTILGDYDDPKLPKNTLDYVFVIDTYHEMTSYKKMLVHFKNSLKTNGKLILLEKIKKHAIGKSRDAQVSAHTLSLKYVKKELQEAGFNIEKQVNNFGYWERDKTKQMWILIASKP